MPAGWGRRVRHGMQTYAINQSPVAQTPAVGFVGLNPVDPLDTAAGYTAGTTEPSATGSYARQAVTWTTLAAYTTFTGDATIPVTNSNLITFGPSSAAFSPSGPYTFVSLWNTATLATVAETAYWGRAAVSAPTQSVGGAGISLTIAIGALVMGCITS